jgi:Tfp pilus assembly protein PilZ
MTPMPKAAAGAPGPETTDDVIGKVRVPFIQRATLTRNGAEEPLFLVDLGVEGAFAERPDPLPIGETVWLTFRLPGNEIPLAVGCRVAWANARAGRLVTKSLPPGVGLWFVEMEPAARSRLRAYLSEYLRGGLRRFHRPWPPDVEDEP